MDRKEAIANDLWLESQLEQFCQTIAAAACFMAAVVVTAVVTRSDAQAASVEQNDFSNRLNDLYDYLDDYTMGEPVENAALYENSIIELL